MINIVSDGTVRGTKLIDAETGKDILEGHEIGITKVTVTIDPTHGLTYADVSFVRIGVGMVAEPHYIDVTDL